MNRISQTVIALCLALPVFAAADENPLSKLDSEIAASLASEKWDYASKAFVRVLWDDYRKAHLSPTGDRSARSVFGKMPEVEKYEEYIGIFGRGADASRPFLEIVQDSTGRFHVKLEGHTFPSVMRNKSIVFTTGDVVYSHMPQLASKPYCTLELFMVIRTGGSFFFAGPSTPPEKWTPLSKLEGR